MNEPRELSSRLMRDAELLLAVRRELSFTRAGETLGLQQSAVSHRVSALEKALGTRLFERTTRRLQMTSAGHLLCDAAAECFKSWSAALAELERRKSSGAMRVSVSASLAMKWLVPRLPAAQRRGLEIVLDVDDAVADLHEGPVQVAIRYGKGPYPGFHSVQLCRAELTPVSRAGYEEPPLSEEVLSGGRCALISDRRGAADGTDFDWLAYVSGCGWQVDELPIVASFERTDLALQAAIGGMGIALGRTLLIERDLKDGFLQVAGPTVTAAAGYWLVTTPSFADTDAFRALSQWLRDEIRRDDVTQT